MIKELATTRITVARKKLPENYLCFRNLVLRLPARRAALLLFLALMVPEFALSQTRDPFVGSFRGNGLQLELQTTLSMSGTKYAGRLTMSNVDYWIHGWRNGATVEGQVATNPPTRFRSFFQGPNLYLTVGRQVYVLQRFNPAAQNAARREAERIRAGGPLPTTQAATKIQLTRSSWYRQLGGPTRGSSLYFVFAPGGAVQRITTVSIWTGTFSNLMVTQRLVGNYQVGSGVVLVQLQRDANTGRWVRESYQLRFRDGATLVDLRNGDLWFLR